MSGVITKLRATQVLVRAREGYVDRPGFGDPVVNRAKKWMIELFAGDGIVGYGETIGGANLRDIEYAAGHLVGKPLLSLPWARPIPPDYSSHLVLGYKNPVVPHRFHDETLPTPSGTMGVLIALHDAIAKAVGWRVCDLFGQTHREWIATDWWMRRCDPDHAARQMRVGLNLGYNSVKFKVTADDDIVATLKAIKRVAGDETRIVVDATGRLYRFCEAAAFARQIDDAGMTNIVFEDPFPFHAHEWRLFRKKTSVQLTCHNAAPTRVALDEHACDHVNIGYQPDQFFAKAAMADYSGVQCWIGSNVDLGVIDAYILHCAAAAKNCVLPSDAMGHDIREDDLIEETLETRDGHTKLPEGPGLGVTLDRKAMEKYTLDAWECAA